MPNKFKIKIRLTPSSIISAWDSESASVLNSCDKTSKFLDFQSNGFGKAESLFNCSVKLELVLSAFDLKYAKKSLPNINPITPTCEKNVDIQESFGSLSGSGIVWNTDSSTKSPPSSVCSSSSFSGLRCE